MYRLLKNIIIIKKNKVKLIQQDNELLSTIIYAVESKKGKNILIIDLVMIKETVFNYLLICEATSSIQIKAIGEYTIYMAKKKHNITPYGEEGKQNLQWYLIDYVDIVVHIFLPKTRKLYNLEEYWSDASIHTLNTLQ